MWSRIVGFVMTVALVCGFGTGAAAVMPPHVNEVTFDRDTFVLEGYSLGHVGVEDELTLVDAETEESIPYTHDLTCETENRCGGDKKPGCVQKKCTLNVKLTDPQPGQKVRLEFFDAEKTVHVLPAMNPPDAGGSERPVTVDFNDVRLEEAANFLTSFTDRTYEVDPAIADERMTLVVEEPVSPEKAVELLEEKVAELGFQITERNDERIIAPGD